jgi:hypothetical protein
MLHTYKAIGYSLRWPRTASRQLLTKIAIVHDSVILYQIIHVIGQKLLVVVLGTSDFLVIRFGQLSVNNQIENPLRQWPVPIAAESPHPFLLNI